MCICMCPHPHISDNKLLQFSLQLLEARMRVINCRIFRHITTQVKDRNFMGGGNAENEREKNGY